MPPNLRRRAGDSRIVRGNYFLSVPQCRGNDRVLTLGSLPQGRAKRKVFTSSLPPGGGAYSWALKAEKS